MDSSFDELENIINTQRHVLQQTGSVSPDFDSQIINLLARHGIELRQRDGVDPKVTVSIPTSEVTARVVGLRYTKRDGTKTEDHFLFRRNEPISYQRGLRLERLMPEYIGMHKADR